VFGARTRLRDALAEACAMLEDLEATAPAQPPADVTDYLAREIWTDAAKVPAGPLIVTIAAFARGSHLPAEAVRRALGELRTAGKISCYRYFRGLQTEIDPTRLIPQALSCAGAAARTESAGPAHSPSGVRGEQGVEHFHLAGGEGSVARHRLRLDGWDRCLAEFGAWR
jgi:hypothetical protein